MEKPEITIEIDYSAKDYRPFLFRRQWRSILGGALFVFLALFISYVVASNYIVEGLSSQFWRVALAYLIAVPLCAILLSLVQ